jgi:hypothetical protein
MAEWKPHFCTNLHQWERVVVGGCVSSEVTLLLHFLRFVLLFLSYLKEIGSISTYTKGFFSLDDPHFGYIKSAKMECFLKKISVAIIRPIF